MRCARMSCFSLLLRKRLCRVRPEVGDQSGQPGTGRRPLVLQDALRGISALNTAVRTLWLRQCVWLRCPLVRAWWSLLRFRMALWNISCAVAEKLYRLPSRPWWVWTWLGATVCKLRLHQRVLARASRNRRTRAAARRREPLSSMSRRRSFQLSEAPVAQCSSQTPRPTGGRH